MNAEYKDIGVNDIPLVIPMCIEWYNGYDGGCWTEETLTKRYRQIITREDSFGLLMYVDGDLKGFAVGYYEQFSDGFVYDLAEILISADSHRKGLGSALMREIERRAKEAGAILVQLTAVGDDMHDLFYGKLGYGDCTNNKLKSKVL